MSANTSHVSEPFAPVAAGLFEGQGEQTRLLGSRCRGCGAAYFPRRLVCCNPHCADKYLELVSLGPQGTLYSVTVQTYRPPALFVMDNWAPYALGLVDLSEGLRVLAMLTGRPPVDWCIGEPVRLTTEVLYCNLQGMPVLTFKFCPAPMALAAHEEAGA